MALKNLIFMILAIALGEIALILLTTIAQEVVFDGVSYHASTMTTIVFGGFFTFLAAGIAGFIARITGRYYTLIIPSVISFFIITEMTYLIFSGATKDPVWFDLISGSGLIVGIWVGYHYQELKNSFFDNTFHPNTFQKE